MRCPLVQKAFDTTRSHGRSLWFNQSYMRQGRHVLANRYNTEATPIRSQHALRRNRMEEQPIGMQVMLGLCYIVVVGSFIAMAMA